MAAGRARTGIYLGRAGGVAAWAGPERSTLVVGPSRSGKTSSIIVPNVLVAPGAVVSTSTKPDVLLQTAKARTEVGQPLLYDPSGTVDPPPGARRVGWSPVSPAARWDGALAVADAMVGAARGRAASAGGARPDDHWTERAGALLAPLLHAAALDGVRMRTVVHWVDRHDGSRALAVLASAVGEDAPATDLLAGILATDAREQSGIWSSASGVLGAYRSEAALASTEPPFLDPAAFCEAPNTLYLCAPGARQQLFAPLVVGLLGEVRDAAYARHARDGAGPDGGLRQAPVLLALDEVANIAPLPDLPAIVSEGAGQGLLTLACVQDLAQARARWGAPADAFFSLFGASVILGGVADITTLDTLSALSGDADVVSRSVASSSGSGRRTVTVTDAVVQRRRLPVDVISRGVPGWALTLDARNTIGWVELTPAHRTSPWRELTAGGRERRVEAASRAGGPPSPTVGGWRSHVRRSHTPVRGRDR